MHTILFSGPGLASISRCTGILIRISYLKKWIHLLTSGPAWELLWCFPHYLDSLAYVLHASHSVVVQYMIQIDSQLLFCVENILGSVCWGKQRIGILCCMQSSGGPCQSIVVTRQDCQDQHRMRSKFTSHMSRAPYTLDLLPLPLSMPSSKSTAAKSSGGPLTSSSQHNCDMSDKKEKKNKQQLQQWRRPETQRMRWKQRWRCRRSR